MATMHRNEVPADIWRSSTGETVQLDEAAAGYLLTNVQDEAVRKQACF